MKVLYLAAHTAQLENEDTTYQEILGTRDIGGCMLETNLEGYDLILATPPCNYWSRANYRRETSPYAQKTKHLLPEILKKLKDLGKPYVVENVINKVIMGKVIEEHVDENNHYIELGRHCYFTNIDVDISHLKQNDYIVQLTHPRDRQGGNDVNNTFNYIIKYMKENDKNE